MFKVKFADIGEGLTEGKVTEVLVKVGDSVKMGDSLFHVETDKVDSEIPSPVDGKVAKILIKANQDISVGEVVVEIDDGSATVEESVSEPVEENASVVGSTPVSNEVIQREIIKTDNVSINNGAIKASPLARKMAAKKGIDISQIKGSGPNGRILAADIENGNVSISTSQSFNPISMPSPALSNKPVSKVDYNNPKISIPNYSEPLQFESIKMNSIRKATVKSMQKAHDTQATFSGIKNIDVTEMVNLRKQLKDYADGLQVKLTFLPFIVKATALVLKEMPNINVRNDFENGAIKHVKNINLGIAVDTPEGLVVPVIKSADKYNVFEIAAKINELASKARNKKLSMAEMTEGTFTITNFGSVGLDFATPIPNPPEGAILGIGTMTLTPMYINNILEPRQIMPFSMTADHKIIDGADVGRFLMRVAYYLSKPALLML
ncbi:pyruvate dehydrogenase E2 component [Spiroplasma sp. TIUS-1]|uniref:dihydrolipoamide acetyltransferase family protein n=1 Tax=Spiroplasma sp. TIUS-1 TaxID=216963 RepID=UPI001398EFA1|nr:dihydrolipoamide acetyltransferase family protein [Spiroplasma sp. TIUS-1]QHX35657.1 pyruvate dehydrogenase E2 component [Spiroplasma sp. TIUS-1]